MAENRELQEVEAAHVAKSDGSASEVETTRGERYVTPRVDIFETDNELVLVADVPGTTQDGLDLKLEDGVLEVTAHRHVDSAQPTFSEYRPASYFRAFRLSDEINSDKIAASLLDGVLTVTLPKSPRAKPRKIVVAPG